MRGLNRLVAAAVVTFLALSLSPTFAFSSTEQVTLPGTVEAWIYPAAKGSPTCDVTQELEHVASPLLSVLKPEYLDVNGSGAIIVDTAADYPCNGYSVANLAIVKRSAHQVLVTVSAGGAQVGAALSSAARRGAVIAAIANFVVVNKLAGVDLDFEPSVWSKSSWSGFLKVLRGLHSALPGGLIEVDLAAYQATPGDATNYAAVAATGAKVVVMAYDDEYNSPCGAITPFRWLTRVVHYALSQVPASQLAVGLPAYGYTTTNCHSDAAITSNVAFTTLATRPGFPTSTSRIAADRGKGSGEIRWVDRGVHYDLVDATALDDKVKLVESLGISDVSVWSLGGESWFSGDPPTWTNG